MTTRTPTYYDSTQLGIKPMGAGDTVPSSMVPISTRSGNEISAQADGIYVGRTLRLAKAYVAASGTDATNSGTLAQPFRTIDYALTNLLGSNPLTGDLTLVLKAGETFSQATRFNVSGGNIIMAWYSDAQYGEYPGTPVAPTGADPSVMADLVRPIIAPAASLVSGQWRIGGFNLIDGRGSVSLPGVTVTPPTIPAGTPPSDAYSMYSDYVIWANGGTGSLNLYGTITNKPDASLFGLCGLHARAAACSLTQFASQFLCGGVKVIDSSSAANLLARGYFIKFYPDFPGNNQQSTSPIATSSNSSPGSAILNLMWSETSAQAVTGARQNLETYPKRFDQSFGLRNYFLNLVRNQQQNPINVVAGFLF